MKALKSICFGILLMGIIGILPARADLLSLDQTIIRLQQLLDQYRNQPNERVIEDFLESYIQYTQNQQHGSFEEFYQEYITANPGAKERIEYYLVYGEDSEVGINSYVTHEELAAAIAQALQGVGGVSMDQVETAIQNALNGLSSYATEEDIQNAIANALSNLGALSRDEIEQLITEMSGEMPYGFTYDELEALIDELGLNLDVNNLIQALKDLRDAGYQPVTLDEVRSALNEVKDDLGYVDMDAFKEALKRAKMQQIIDALGIQNLTADELVDLFDTIQAEHPEVVLVLSDFQSALEGAMDEDGNVDIEKVRNLMDEAAGRSYATQSQLSALQQQLEDLLDQWSGDQQLLDQLQSAFDELTNTVANQDVMSGMDNGQTEPEEKDDNMMMIMMLLMMLMQMMGGGGQS